MEVLNHRKEKRKELCAVCEPALQTRRGPFEGVFSLGLPQEIAQRRECCLCRMVLHLLAQYGAADDENWLSITLYSQPTDEFLAVLRFADGTHMPLGRIQVATADRAQLKFPPADQLSLVNPDQVIEWMQRCRDTHGHACEESLVDRYPQELILIDVQKRRLVRVHQKHEFVALSYVWGGWGGAEVTKTTSANVDFLMTEGSLDRPEVTVASTVRDAMDLCRKIGQSFLWCDLFCIVQDDPARKHTQIQQMDSIYNQATLTILAYTGTHGDEELPGLREGSRVPICRTERFDSDRVLVSRPPSIWDYQQKTAYGSRGWTFQEDCLSKRRLYITKFQMYFECSVAHFREDERLDASLQQPHQHLRTQTECLNLRELINPTGFAQFSSYGSLLSVYTSKSLTYASDRLDAFEGVAQVLGREWGTRFWAGLPSKYLLEALLWRPLRCHDLIDGALTCFPSWSWGSRAVQIHHAFPNDLDLDIGGCTLREPPERIKCVSTFRLSYLTEDYNITRSQPHDTEALKSIVARESTSISDSATWEPDWWMVSSHQYRGLFLFALEFSFPALVELEKAFHASNIDPWQRMPLAKSEIERFRTNLLGGSLFPKAGQNCLAIDDAELDAILAIFGKLPQSGPLRFPEWLFKVFNAGMRERGRNPSNGWPFGQPVNHERLETLLQASEHFARDLSEYREGILQQPSILSFWTSAVSMSHFSFASGQLYGPEVPECWVMATQDGRRTCDIQNLEFRAEERSAQHAYEEKPAAIISDSSETPCGVVYDQENNIRESIDSLSTCYLVFISRMKRPRKDKDWDLLNVLLVEEKKGYIFKRVAAGCILATTPELGSAQPMFIRLA